jgi:hypothetical protein
VISGEEVSHKGRWGERQGERVEVHVRREPRCEGVYAWLEVECKDALELREALGLSREPHVPLHLTLGRRKDLKR